MKEREIEFRRWSVPMQSLSINNELSFMDGKLYRSTVEDSNSNTVPKLPYHYYIKIVKANGDIEIWRGASLKGLNAADFGFNFSGYEKITNDIS